MFLFALSRHLAPVAELARLLEFSLSVEGRGPAVELDKIFGSVAGQVWAEGALDDRVRDCLCGNRQWCSALRRRLLSMATCLRG